MMSLPDPSLEEEAIPEFLRPVVAAIKSLIASPPVLKTVSGASQIDGGAKLGTPTLMLLPMNWWTF